MQAAGRTDAHRASAAQRHLGHVIPGGNGGIVDQLRPAIAYFERTYHRSALDSNCSDRLLGQPRTAAYREYQHQPTLHHHSTYIFKKFSMIRLPCTVSTLSG